jgi:hypothetical protein
MCAAAANVPQPKPGTNPPCGLIYAARTRNGFTPGSRVALFKKFAGLESPNCPFVNFSEATSGRWGQGLTKAKMADRR